MDSWIIYKTIVNNKQGKHYIITTDIENNDKIRIENNDGEMMETSRKKLTEKIYKTIDKYFNDNF